VADIDSDEEGRPAFGGGERFGVALGLSAGFEHGLVPTGGTSNGSASAIAGSGTRQFFWRWTAYRIAALLSFEDDAASAIQVDEVGRGGAVEFLKVDSLVDDVGVESFVGLTWVGAREVEEVAEFGERS
jgi:hypothetical protein